MPLAGFASYVFDGVFVGAGWTRAMLLTMAAAMAAFLVLLVVLQRFGDGGLWLAFCLFLFVRGAGQARPSCFRAWCDEASSFLLPETQGSAAERQARKVVRSTATAVAGGRTP